MRVAGYGKLLIWRDLRAGERRQGVIAAIDPLTVLSYSTVISARIQG